MELTTIPERLKSAREALGISARELDRRAELTEGHTSQLERDPQRGVEKRTMDRLASALGVHPAWLTYGVGPRTADDLAADPRPSSTPPSPAASKAA